MNGDARPAMRCDETDEPGVALRRIGLERRFITFEHRVDPTFEQILNAQDVTHQLGKGPLLRLDSPLKRRVAKSVGDAPDVIGMKRWPRRSSARRPVQ